MDETIGGYYGHCRKAALLLDHPRSTAADQREATISGRADPRVARSHSAVDGKLHAYINLMADSAMAEARAAEAEIAKGNWRGPMHGIPIAVKDQLDVEGAPARIRQSHQGRRRCHRGAQVARGRRGDDGQAAHEQFTRRGTAAAAQPVEHGTYHRRIEHRLGRRGGRRLVSWFPRRRHGGIDPQSVGVLRPRGIESDLWAGEPARSGASQLVARSLRPDRARWSKTWRIC